jgi:RNA polymerase sigma-70 factor (ECF subfamily)
VRERAIAEELTQESFIRVLHARERYRPEARFSTWLFHIGRNLALNELDRAQRRKPHLSTDASDCSETWHTARPALTLVSSAPCVETVVDARRQQSLVLVILAELPERQRSALWLTAVEGFSYLEIAELLDTSTQSVKALIHRARATLADRIAEVPSARGARA